MPRSTSLLLICLFAMLASVNLFTSDGLVTDLGSDPDEPSHAVTSLMIRDYLAGGFMQSPMPFAQRYYADFPKVALGHYPPVYYLLGGVALLLHPQPETLVVLQYLIAIAIAWVTARLSRDLMTPLADATAKQPLALRFAPGLFAGAITLLLPILVKIQYMVMADLLLVLCVLLSAWAWVAFLKRPSASYALLFGMLAATTILTKGSGLLLGAVPVVSLILLRRWSLLKDWRWWLAGVPVALFAGPWMVLTTKISQEGMMHIPVTEFFGKALGFYLHIFPETFGGLFIVGLLLGLFFLLRQTWQNRLSELDATLLAVFIGSAAVILGISAGLTARYLSPLVPILALFSLLGFYRALGLLFKRLPALHAMLFCLLGLLLLISVQKPTPPKVNQGFSEAVVYALPSAASATLEKPVHWLVCSDPRGEGGIIAEAAFRLPQRAPSPLRIHRAGKDLSTSDWLGRGYETPYKTEAAVLARLDELGITAVFLDLSVPAQRRLPHQEMLTQALEKSPERWQLTHTSEVIRQAGQPSEPMKVYQKRL